MQAIVTWECGGVGATCVACAIIPRGGGARAHATRVRSHAGTGDGVAARSECRLEKVYFPIHTRSLADANFHALLAFRASRLDKSRARASVPRSIPPPRDSSPRVLSARRLRRLAIRVGSARRPGRGPRSASGPERASSSRASRDPRASRSPFRRKRQTGRWREVRLDDQINRASEASGGKTRRSENSPISRARDGLPEPRARASADAVRAPRRAGLGRGPGDATAALARAPRPPLARQPARGARAGARREPPRPIRRGRRQHDPNDPANDDDDDEFARRGCCSC